MLQWRLNAIKTFKSKYIKFFKRKKKKQDLNLETTRAAFPKMWPQTTLSPHDQEGGLVKTKIPRSDYFPILGSYVALL